ncbi:MAG: undecaprenyldiphospho-muramoylpentapeptide beta-N-acetylglucosaminyltransferase [bacterium]
MRILLTGGGTGGHFYPLIAVAEAINEIVKKENLLRPEIFFMSDAPYDAEALVQNGIKYIPVSAGKSRRYFSILNFLDIFKTGWGVISSIFKLYSLYPDVIFSKGAYNSFPVLLAARILRIPVIIHESDTVPGRTNMWASKFATKIAISYPDTEKYFRDKDKVAYTGNPIRKEIKNTPEASAYEYLKLDRSIPTILILGGSLGARIINESILNALPKLVEKYQIIHQAGKNNIESVAKTSEVILTNSPYKSRYRLYDYLNDLNMGMAAGAANLIISRAGSTLFEIANWGIPSIVIPITDTNGDHQRNNAYAYARSGAATVIEEANLTTNLLISEINRLIENKDLLQKMSDSAKNFAKLDAASKIARELIEISLSHE